MAPKKRPATTPKKKLVTDTHTSTSEPPMVLLPEVLDDLRYLEPTRTRNRVISALNEAFLRIISLERMHQEPAPKKKPKRR